LLLLLRRFGFPNFEEKYGKSLEQKIQHQKKDRSSIGYSVRGEKKVFHLQLFDTKWDKRS